MITLRNYIPKFLHSTKWATFVDVFSTILNDVYDDLLDTFFDHINKDEATSEDFIEIIQLLGYPLNLNYSYTHEFLKRKALTTVERVRTKTTPTSYERLFYSLFVLGYVYPMVETEDEVLLPKTDYGSLTDIGVYIASLGYSQADARKYLTKHMDVRIAPKHALPFQTDYYLTLPAHHYKLNETSGSFCTDDGTNPIFGSHNLPADRLGKNSLIPNSTCYNFNGTSQYVDTNDNSASADKTICLWAKKDSLSNNTALFGSKDNLSHGFWFGFTDTSTGKMGAGLGTEDWGDQFDVKSVLSKFSAQNWNWYVLEYTNATNIARLFVNNTLIGYVTGASTMSISDYFISCQNDDGVFRYFFDGRIDDVRIYNYIISSETRSDVYNGGSAGGQGREDNVVKNGDLKQLLDENTLNISKYEVEQIKKLEEVPHFSAMIDLVGDETGTINETPLYDIDGNLISGVTIQTLSTVFWLRSAGIYFDQINPDTNDYYQFDETTPWLFDTIAEDFLDEITQIKLGSAAFVIPTFTMNRVQEVVFTHNIESYEKSETSTQYLFDIDIGRTLKINEITEVGLLNDSGTLLFYAKFPKLVKINDFNFRIKITIDKS